MWILFRICLITRTLAYDNNDGYTRCRYLDIGLGVVLLVSMLALLQGGWSLQPVPLVIFLTLSLAVLVSYWIWYLYVNIIATNYPVFEEQVEILSYPTMLYVRILGQFLLYMGIREIMMGEGNKQPPLC